MRRVYVFLLALAICSPAFACPKSANCHRNHGPLRGAVNDTVAIGKSFGSAGEHAGSAVVRGVKAVGRFGKWLVS